MTGRNEHVLNEVLVTLLHAGNALAAALLNIVKFHGLALDVTYICVGNNAVLLGDKVLNINIAHNVGNFGAAVVREFIAKI